MSVSHPNNLQKPARPTSRGLRAQRVLDESPVWADPESGTPTAVERSPSPGGALVAPPEDIKPILRWDSSTNLIPDDGDCNLSHQQPNISHLVKESIARFNSTILFIHALPPLTTKNKFAKDAVSHTLLSFEPAEFAREMERRIQTDQRYINRLIKMVRCSISFF